LYTLTSSKKIIPQQPYFQKSTDLAVRNDTALTAHTSIDLIRPRPSMKVFHGFFLWQFLNGTFNTNLSHINTTNDATAHWLNSFDQSNWRKTADFSVRYKPTMYFAHINMHKIWLCSTASSAVQIVLFHFKLNRMEYLSHYLKFW